MIRSIGLYFILFSLLASPNSGWGAPVFTVELPTKVNRLSGAQIQTAAAEVWSGLQTLGIFDQGMEQPSSVRILVVESSEFLGFTPKASVEPDTIYLSSRIKSLAELQLVFAHEFVHLIRHRYCSEDDLWLEEGMAKVIESIFANDWAEKYDKILPKIAEIRLSSSGSAYWSRNEGAFEGYVTSYYLSQYLFNRLGGMEFVRAWLKSPLQGWDAIEAIAKSQRQKGRIGIPEKFLTRRSLFLHFSVAAVINDPFSAQYSLFHLDRRYSPLSTTKKTEFQFAASSSGESLELCLSENKGETPWVVAPGPCSPQSLRLRVTLP